MIVVSVQLWSAITSEKTELARMEICNDGTSAARLRNYDARTLRGRSLADLNKRTTQRQCRVEKHDAPGLHVWNLVAKALTAMGYGHSVAVAVAEERDRCAKIADAYADENRRMASDSIMLDPVFSGADFSPEAFAKSEAMTVDMCIASSMMHAAQNIAAEIRKSKP